MRTKSRTRTLCFAFISQDVVVGSTHIAVIFRVIDCKAVPCFRESGTLSPAALSSAPAPAALTSAPALGSQKRAETGGGVSDAGFKRPSQRRSEKAAAAALVLRS